MFSCECVLAAVLLAAPAEQTHEPWEAETIALLRPALMQLALDAEVLDPREECLLNCESRDPAGDLRELRTRWLALALAPALEENRRFPERRLIEQFLDFNRAYRKDLLDRLEVDTVHAEELKHAVAETDELYRIWDTLRDARSGIYYVPARRLALQRVRTLVGPRAFYSGQLPPHVPIWHFAAAR